MSYSVGDFVIYDGDQVGKVISVYDFGNYYEVRRADGFVMIINGSKLNKEVGDPES